MFLWANGVNIDCCGQQDHAAFDSLQILITKLMSFFPVYLCVCDFIEIGRLFRAEHQVFWPQMKVEEGKTPPDELFRYLLWGQAGQNSSHLSTSRSYKGVQTHTYTHTPHRVTYTVAEQN